MDDIYRDLSPTDSLFLDFLSSFGCGRSEVTVGMRVSLSLLRLKEFADFNKIRYEGRRLDVINIYDIMEEGQADGLGGNKRYHINLVQKPVGERPFRRSWIFHLLTGFNEAAKVNDEMGPACSTYG
jgi:hypothetical protein